MTAKRPADAARLADASFAVADVDVTGTDVYRDGLTGLALVIVERGTIPLSRRYHGRLGASAAADREVAEEFLRRTVGLPVVSFRSGFTRAMLQQLFGAPLPREALRFDMALLLPALVDDTLDWRAPLEAWLHRAGIAPLRQHHAAADAYAIAQLLLLALPRAEEKGIHTLGDLDRLQSKWRRLRAAAL